MHLLMGILILRNSAPGPSEPTLHFPHAIKRRGSSDISNLARAEHLQTAIFGHKARQEKSCSKTRSPLHPYSYKQVIR